MATADRILIVLCTMMFVRLCTTGAVDPDKPSNISCIWNAKRKFTCDFSVDGDRTTDEYTCSVCPHFRGVSPPNDTCPSDYEAWTVSTGRCEYDCDVERYCRESLMIKITASGNTSPESASWCRLVDQAKYVKPGPVTDLTLTPDNSHSFNVKWRKPADRDNDDDVYLYHVYCPQNSTHPTRMKRSRKEEVEAKCRHLLPCQRYNITVRAKLKHGGYWSTPQTASALTPESVPTSGPTVPKGAFSVVSQDQLVIYWSVVPVMKRSGDIKQYSVSVDECLNITVPADTYWTTINRSHCGSGPHEVRTYAATRIGWSKTPFVRKINPQWFEASYVQYVQKSGQELSWKYTMDSVADSFHVYWCYGNQDIKQPQLVKCQGAIGWETLPPERRRMTLAPRDTPSISCSLCEWRYAVSVNINNISTGMVWDTPNATDPGRALADTSTADSGEDDTMKTMIIVTLALVAGLCLAVISIIVVVLYRKNVICERIIIVLPKLQSFETSDTEETTFSLSTSKSTNEKLRKLIKPLLRDSGNISMDTSKNQSGSSVRCPPRSARVPAIVEGNNETITFLITSEDSQEVSAEVAPERHPHGHTAGEDQWLYGETSGMSDYRQVACSLDDELEDIQDVSSSSKLRSVFTHRDCSSAPCTFTFLYHAHSLPSLPARSAAQCPLVQSGMLTDPRQRQRSDHQPGQHSVRSRAPSAAIEVRSSDCESDRCVRFSPLQQSLLKGEDVFSENVYFDVTDPAQHYSHKQKPVDSKRLSAGAEGSFKSGRKTLNRSSGSGDETSVASYAAVASERN